MNNTTYPYRRPDRRSMLDNLSPLQLSEGMGSPAGWRGRSSRASRSSTSSRRTLRAGQELPRGPSPSGTPRAGDAHHGLPGIVYGGRGTWAYSMSELTPFPGTEWVWTGLSNVARSCGDWSAARVDDPIAIHRGLSSRTRHQGPEQGVPCQDYMIKFTPTPAAAPQQSVNLGARARDDAEVIGEARLGSDRRGGVLKDTGAPYDVKPVQESRRTDKDPSVQQSRRPHNLRTYRKKGSRSPSTVKSTPAAQRRRSISSGSRVPPYPAPAARSRRLAKVKDDQPGHLSWTNEHDRGLHDQGPRHRRERAVQGLAEVRSQSETRR